MNPRIKNILLVEDDPRDLEPTLAGLAEHHLANKVLVDAIFIEGKEPN
jgi:hypothetical protein